MPLLVLQYSRILPMSVSLEQSLRDTEVWIIPINTNFCEWKNKQVDFTFNAKRTSSSFQPVHFIIFMIHDHDHIY